MGVAIEIGIGLVLVIAVFLMRRIVQKTAFAFPNENLVLQHTINFIVWLILYTAQEVLQIQKGTLSDVRDDLTPSDSEYEATNVAYF